MRRPCKITECGFYRMEGISAIEMFSWRLFVRMIDKCTKYVADLAKRWANGNVVKVIFHWLANQSVKWACVRGQNVTFCPMDRCVTIHVSRNWVNSLKVSLICGIRLKIRCGMCDIMALIRKLEYKDRCCLI